MKVIINAQYKHLTDFIKNLPETFGKEGETLYQGRNLIKAFTVQGTEIVVKHYKCPNFVQKIAYRWLRPSKAQRAYIFALRLVSMNIDTPEAIAYIEKQRFGLFQDCWFVSARCHDEPLFPVLVERPDYDQELAKCFAQYLVKLHLKGFLHGDLNLANILFRKENQTFHFSVIDINRSKFIKHPSPKECLRNLMRVTHRIDLLRNIVTAYAEERQWNAKECCCKVEHFLHEFERRRARKYKWKKMCNK